MWETSEHRLAIHQYSMKTLSVFRGDFLVALIYIACIVGVVFRKVQNQEINSGGKRERERERGEIFYVIMISFFLAFPIKTP